MNWNVLLAPIIAALAEALTKAFLKWLGTWDEPGDVLTAIDKVADAVLLFYDSDKGMKDYLALRATMNEIREA